MLYVGSLKIACFTSCSIVVCTTAHWIQYHANWPPAKRRGISFRSCLSVCMSVIW